MSTDAQRAYWRHIARKRRERRRERRARRRVHACNRGAVVKGGRGCWWCHVSRKLGVKP